MISKIELRGSAFDLQQKLIACEALIPQKNSKTRELRKGVDIADLCSRRKTIDIHGIKQWKLKT